MQENFIGIDVGSKELVVALKQSGQTEPSVKTFPNTAAGHQKLLKYATRRCGRALICVEATGIYSLELSLALQRSEKIALMVANPRAIKDFARAAMKRGKTDRVDAQVILLYLERMPFVSWTPPREEVLELRTITRRIVQLKVELGRERNRLHASSRRRSVNNLISNDIDVNMRHLERRIKRLEMAGLDLISSVPDLKRKLEQLVSVKGIGTASAMRILAELMILPSDMRAEQWVAHAGLDPRPFESGTSIAKPRRISKAGNKFLRAALFMPALVGIKLDPHIKAFYEKLIVAGKKPIQAIVAVMRKLLHAIWGMIKHDQDFIGDKFYVIPLK